MSPRIIWLAWALAAGSGAAAPTVVNPVITNATPDPVDAGGQAFLVTVTGSGFASTSVIRLGETALTTTFISSTQLKGEITAALRVISGHPNLTVVNVDGGVSAARTFHVSPVIASITPNALVVNTPA